MSTQLRPIAIDMAPKDGTVILSNAGTVRWSPNFIEAEGWYLCDLHGNIPKCAEEHYDISRAFPTKWIPDALEYFI